MKRAGITMIAIAALALVALVTFLAVENARQRDRIADLEERNAALSRLCGPDSTREPYEPLRIEHPVPDATEP